MPTTANRLARRARFASAVVVVASVGLFVWSLIGARHNRLPTGGGLGADHLAFYDAGDILRRFGAGRLYDLPLQSALYHDRLPGEPPDAFLPYAYAPHVAAIFAVLARVPYAASYVLWTALSVAAYALAVSAAVWAARLPRGWWATTGWVAAAFEPFAFECVHGGQVSTVAAALLSVAAAFSVAGQPFAAGLIAGCCCYKPTLLVILTPGLAITRRWRTLAGCVSAVAGWAILDVLAFGVGPCRMYATLLSGYATHGAIVFRTWKFIDVHSFVLLQGGSPGAATAAVTVAVAVALAGLRRAGASDDERLFWAAVLAWTPVANLYAGSYDAVLAVPAAVLTAGVLHRRHGDLPAGFVRLLAFVWIAPWVTSASARWGGVQLLTVALTALAAYAATSVSARPDADREGSVRSPVTGMAASAAIGGR
jgi:hypothetical protein